MKTLFYYVAIGLFIASCSSTTKTTTQQYDSPEEAVKITNENVVYDIVITEPGYETYLYSIAKPKNYYSKEFYETKNKFYVVEWNIRAMNPLRYNSLIFRNNIDYDFNVDYGLDVNYKLYNYFKFIEHKYNVRIR